MLFGVELFVIPTHSATQTELDSTHSMLSAHNPTFTPEVLRDHGMIRQNRLQKFLLNCARKGVKTPLPLNATKQDNATFDTMMEVAAECEVIGIPTPHRPCATASMLPLPPTPVTGATNCIWGAFTNDQTSWTPDIPEHDGGSSPNFPEVFASFLTCRKDCDGYGADYDPTKDPYCVAYDGYGADYDPTKDPYCVAYEYSEDEYTEEYDPREECSIAHGSY